MFPGKMGRTYGTGKHIETIQSFLQRQSTTTCNISSRYTFDVLLLLLFLLLFSLLFLLLLLLLFVVCCLLFAVCCLLFVVCCVLCCVLCVVCCLLLVACWLLLLLFWGVAPHRYLQSGSFASARVIQRCLRHFTTRHIMIDGLVGDFKHFLFFHILGRILLTDYIIFFRGVGIPPTRMGIVIPCGDESEPLWLYQTYKSPHNMPFRDKVVLHPPVMS